MKRTDQKYLLASVSLSLVFVMALVPGNTASQVDEGKFYGSAEMILYDNQGQEMFTQTVHNRLLDAGEDYMLSAAFGDSTSIVDNVSIGAICVTEATITDAETETAADFDGDTALATNNCEIGTAIISSGTAVIGPLNFEAATNNNNIPAATTISGIGVCQRNSSGTDFNDCATTGILFAQVDTTDVTLASGETVDVTYTFDISSATN